VIRLVLLVLAVVALLALIWWSAGLPERGPGDRLARKYRERGGGLGGGGGFGGGQ
jgi:ABC-type transporter Mla subunit MlaD